VSGPATSCPLSSQTIPANLLPNFAAHYAALSGQAALAEDEPIDLALAERGREIARNGLPDLAGSCDTCHAPAGIGAGQTPALAGQKPAYIEARLTAWRDGEVPGTGITRIMIATAKKLSDDDITAVAAYYGSLDGNGKERIALTQVPTPKAHSATIKPRDKKGLSMAKAQKVWDKWKAEQDSGKLYDHTPPAFADIPKGPEGEMIRYGRHLFNNTQVLRGKNVGNDLSCRNCHMKDGITAGLAPMWGMASLYPNYRGKNKHVNTIDERIGGCFKYSMDGTPPEPHSNEMVALVSYATWAAEGIPLGAKPRGTVFDKIAPPALEPTYERGQKVYVEKSFNACHGENGEGQKSADGAIVYPPLWGERSFNWGAGMHTIEKAAAFIKKAMPLNSPDLTNQEAWDVAYFMDSHERPQDPRWTGDVEKTQALSHSGGNNLYGTVDRKSTRLNSSHSQQSRMPSSA